MCVSTVFSIQSAEFAVSPTVYGKKKNLKSKKTTTTKKFIWNYLQYVLFPWKAAILDCIGSFCFVFCDGFSLGSPGWPGPVFDFFKVALGVLLICQP